jgi:hypothetical protein
MNFKIWLEYQEKDFNYYKNLVLGMLNLESPEGLSASLDTFKPDILISSLEAMGEFKELNSDIQQQVKDKIQVGEGSIEDLIRLMADDSD